MKKNKRYIRNLEKHISTADSNVKYSLDRFDILIISISSGGLVFSMGFVKDILSEINNIDFTLLKLSWVGFSFSIIINLLSQVSSYFANSLDIVITRNIIKEERGKPIIWNKRNFEIKQNIYDFLTNSFNALSLLSLIASICLLVFFMFLTLK